MPRFMLDTDTCSYIMKRSNDAVLKRLQKAPVNEVCICSDLTHPGCGVGLYRQGGTRELFRGTASPS